VPGSGPFAATGSQVPADPAAAFPSSAYLRLPNGMTVVPQSRVEAEHFYEDIFEKQIYLRHGVTLQPGDCVFDVGGNIGTFSLFASRHAPGGRIFTFEPAPPLFARLRANLELNGATAHAFDHGIAEAERTARFTFYPNSSGMSSFYADADEERAVLRRMMDREREAGLEGMDALMEYTDELLDERFRPVEMECRLRPLSAVIREEGVQRIDLLKIDVQKAELDVLRGIADEDWPRIRQVVMEVHDLEGRLEEVVRLLEAHGFRVAVEQDEAVEGTILYNLFAISHAAPPREDDPSRSVHGESGADVVQGTAGANPWRLLVLSAASPQMLSAATARLALHLAENPALPLAGVARTLREQPALPHRRAVVVRDGEDASARLTGRDPTRVADGAAADEPSVVFLFPGVGELYPGMARGLYDAEPVFRAELYRCADILRRHLDFDVREALFTTDGDEAAPASGGVDLRRMLGRAPASATADRLTRTEVAQPAAFAVGYALARLWESWGIRPAALLGHSLGEYTAACVAGVFTLEDALETVALRARAIQALPAGAMLAVSLTPRAVAPWLGDGVALAAVNAPELCVLSGPTEAITRAEHGLAAVGHVVRRLATTHAFHSPSMQPAAEQVAALATRMRLSPPRIPLLSNVTGTWLTPAEATDPGYWARHLVGTVHFARATEELLARPGRVLVEVGPGGSLGAFVRQQAAVRGTPVPSGVASLPHAAEHAAEPGFVLHALGRLWAAGVQVDWAAFPDQESRRVRLPLAATEGPVSAEGTDSAQEDADDELVRELAAIWGGLLGVEAGPEDDFFLLGGHSVVATRLIARVRERFGVEMRLRTLFQTRTVSGMADWIRHAAAHRG
ncbi:MAG TPA: FkbM family methyltransferase, partial [Longimicrobium sp.]|nr:FkbM family methyltransferase [Longimicrobium sp.]